MITLTLQKSVYLREYREMSPIGLNCNAKYGMPGVPGELVGLVAIFRHGDRAPLNIKTSRWKPKSCIICNGTCKSQACTDGMLTRKGYVQAKRLGSFIRRNYRPLIKLNRLKGYHSSYERTISTLHGVLRGMNESASGIEEEKSIVSSYNVKVLKNIILSSHIKAVKKKRPGEYKLYDEVVSHYCGDVAFDCTKFSCNPHKILSFVEQQQDDFIEYTNLIRANLISMGITLGEFGVFLQKELVHRNSITLISGHDSLIVKLLSGLNVEVKKFPPYTSTIFIEIWKNGNEEFVRVVYDGVVQKVGLYKEDYVTYNNFMKYLEMYSNANKRVRPLLDSDVKKLLTNVELEKATDAVYKAYGPLIDLIQKQGVGIASVPGNAPTKQVSDDGDIGDDLYTATMQFLLGKAS